MLKKYTTLAMLVASAAALQIIESPLPRFLPWLKPGLANALSLYALVKLSATGGVIVAIFRTFLASLLLGTLFSPVFIMSFVGALSSALLMGLLYKAFSKVTNEILSISGALINNLSQLAVIQIMFAENINFMFHIAIMIWVSIPSGYIVAKIVNELLRRTADA